MSANSNIEWTDHTFNPWIGCTKVSPGCDHCYAERREDLRLHRVQWGAGQPRHRTKTWGDPVKWNAAHAAFFAEHGRRQRVFCASLADVFDNEVPPLWRVELLTLIGATEHLDWLLLTKRVGNVKRLLCEAAELAHERGLPAAAHWITSWVDGEPPPNVWLGATVVNQAEADRDIPKLLTTPARVRFLSIEPMLGPVDLTDITLRRGTDDEEHFDALYFDGDPDDKPDLGTATLDWVIAGGESGPGARPAHPDWFRSLEQQCRAAGVPFFLKQMGGARDKRGALEDLPEDLRVREFP
jgi:protein gp37